MFVYIYVPAGFAAAVYAVYSCKYRGEILTRLVTDCNELGYNLGCAFWCTAAIAAIAAVLFCRCAARGSVLARFDGGSLSRDFRPSHLCPISGVQDRCVWIGLLKPWFFWPNPSMLIVFIFKYLGHIIFSNRTYMYCTS